MIAEGISAVEQARSYYNSNADALSVLTDEKYFGGRLEDLWEVNDFLKNHQRFVPTLRKDFMVHPIQILEALEAGARAILLIVRALDNEELTVLRDMLTQPVWIVFMKFMRKQNSKKPFGITLKYLELTTGI